MTRKHWNITYTSWDQSGVRLNRTCLYAWTPGAVHNRCPSGSSRWFVYGLIGGCRSGTRAFLATQWNNRGLTSCELVCPDSLSCNSSALVETKNQSFSSQTSCWCFGQSRTPCLFLFWEQFLKIILTALKFMPRVSASPFPCHKIRELTKGKFYIETISLGFKIRLIQCIFQIVHNNKTWDKLCKTLIYFFFFLINTTQVRAYTVLPFSLFLSFLSSFRHFGGFGRSP